MIWKFYEDVFVISLLIYFVSLILIKILFYLMYFFLWLLFLFLFVNLWFEWISVRVEVSSKCVNYKDIVFKEEVIDKII